MKDQNRATMAGCRCAVCTANRIEGAIGIIERGRTTMGVDALKVIVREMRVAATEQAIAEAINRETDDSRAIEAAEAPIPTQAGTQARDELPPFLELQAARTASAPRNLTMHADGVPLKVRPRHARFRHMRTMSQRLLGVTIESEAHEQLVAMVTALPILHQDRRLWLARIVRQSPRLRGYVQAILRIRPDQLDLVLEGRSELSAGSWKRLSSVLQFMVRPSRKPA